MIEVRRFWRCEAYTCEAAMQEEKLCNEVETVRDITFLGHSVRSGGGFDATVTGWACEDQTM